MNEDEFLKSVKKAKTWREVKWLDLTDIITVLCIIGIILIICGIIIFNIYLILIGFTLMIPFIILVFCISYYCYKVI